MAEGLHYKGHERHAHDGSGGVDRIRAALIDLRPSLATGGLREQASSQCVYSPNLLTAKFAEQGKG